MHVHTTRPEALAEARKALGVSEDAVITAKCWECEADYVWRPYGGATSFAEIDEWKRIAEQQEELWRLKDQLESITMNVMDDENLTPSQKALALSAAVAEFDTRLQALPEQETEKAVPPPTEGADQRGIRAGLRRLLGKYKEPPAESAPSSIDVARSIIASGKAIGVAETDAGLRWVHISSNRFKDRAKDKGFAGEIVSSKALQQAVEWHDRSGMYPEAMIWHTPGTEYGYGDFAAYLEPEGFLVYSGIVYPGMEPVAKAIADSPFNVGASVRFLHPADEPIREGEVGVYNTVWPFETSSVPVDRAANAWTAGDMFVPLAVSKEVAMPIMDAQKRSTLVAWLGPDRVAAIEADAASKSISLEEAGVASREEPPVIAPPPVAAGHPEAAGADPPAPQLNIVPGPGAVSAQVTPVTADAPPTAPAAPAAAPSDVPGWAQHMLMGQELMANSLTAMANQIVALQTGQKSLEERLSVAPPAAALFGLAPATSPLNVVGKTAAPDTANPAVPTDPGAAHFAHLLAGAGFGEAPVFATPAS